jgi:excisionase family DNA binding protein
MCGISVPQYGNTNTRAALAAAHVRARRIIVPKSKAVEPSADKPEGTDRIHSRPITKTELAKFLGVSPRTVDSYVSSRRIPYIKLGRLVRFRLADVERALQRFTVEEVALR